MPQGERIDCFGASTVNETELERCLRIYKNDSLIAWHLGIPKAQVTAARERYKPPRLPTNYFGKHGRTDDRDYRKRVDDAREANVRFVALLQRAQGGSGNG